MKTFTQLDSTQDFVAAFAKLIEALPQHAVILFSPDLRCTMVKGWVPPQIFSTEMGQIVGKPVEEVFPGLKKKVRHLCQAALDGVESRFDYAPDSSQIISVQVLPMVAANGMITGGMVVLQSAVQEGNPELELNHQALIESAPDAIVITNAQGRIILVNGQTERLFGYTRTELLGQCIECLLPLRYREKHFQHLQRYTKVPTARHMGSGLDLLAMAKDGREFPVDVSLSPIPTQSGMMVIGAVRDITTQKRVEAELKHARDEFEHQVKVRTADLENRNKELDAFAQTVAHDLKNPLAVMTGMSELMLQHLDELSEAEVRKYLRLIARDGRRLDNIINELMVLSGLQQLEPTLEPTNVAAVAKAAINHLDYMIKQHNAKIVCTWDWPPAIGYAPWIETIWVNYISNAIKYGGTPLTIELGADPPVDGMVRFWIKDNGNGLTESERAKLFTAFTRLSTMQVEGYGVGLSIVKRAVEKLGGQVGVESQVGKGSTFFFTLIACD